MGWVLLTMQSLSSSKSSARSPVVAAAVTMVVDWTFGGVGGDCDTVVVVVIRFRVGVSDRNVHHVRPRHPLPLGPTGPPRHHQ